MGKSTRVAPQENLSEEEIHTIIDDTSTTVTVSSVNHSNNNNSSSIPTASNLSFTSSTSSSSSSTIMSSKSKKSNCCSSFFSSILHGIESIIVSCIRALPSEIRYFLTLIAFWPTALFNRWYCYMFPHRRQLWNRIHEYILLSSAPLYPQDVQTLYTDYNVRAVVNMCREWNPHDVLYKNLDIDQCYLPTIDFDPPTFDQLLKGVEFVKKQINAKRTVVIHCKAGRGRSVALCLAYFVCHEGLSPEAADAHIRAIRPHISSKWRLDAVQAFVGLRNRVASSLHPLPHHNAPSSSSSIHPAMDHHETLGEGVITMTSLPRTSSNGKNSTKRRGSASNSKTFTVNDKEDLSGSVIPPLMKDDDSTKSLLVVR